MKLREYKHVHFIGIGGIGISAIARYCHTHGARVTGSDSGSWPVTPALLKEGITVYTDYSVSHIEEGTTLVIYTIATKNNNPEFLSVQKRGIKCISYPEALGMLTEEYTTIAVCGTHGKTTTTAMVASMLKACGKSPTVVVGSFLADGGSNFVAGDSEYLVVEACEYKRSFLNLHPTHVLVTNIDEDHLDYYKDIDDIKSAFQSFADKIPNSGSLTTHSDVDLITPAKKVNADTIDVDSLELSVLGLHNKRNAQLVFSLGKELSLPETDIRKGLLAFVGTARRLEYKGTQKGAIMYDDYGHHPREIQATLQALREKYPSGLNAIGGSVASPDRPKGGSRKFKLVVVFQPHLYSRTKLLLDDFATAFTLADKICVLPIYAAREKDDETISSHDLVEKMDNAIYMETFDEVKKYIDKNCHSGSVVLTIGAGDVYRIHELFI